MPLTFIKKDIVRIEADAIVNAANARGYMGGWIGRIFRLRGVSESIHYVTRGKVENEFRAVCRQRQLSLGDVVVTQSRSPLQSRYIFHAITMLKPGQKSNIEVVRGCVTNVLREARERNCNSIAIPLLGAGTGRVDPKVVLNMYLSIMEGITDINVIVVIGPR